MIVVGDSSPLIVLVNIGHIGILPALFDAVFIPPQIAAELSDAKRPHAVQEFIAGKPLWLRIQAPASVEPIPDIHEGQGPGDKPAQGSALGMRCHWRQP